MNWDSGRFRINLIWTGIVDTSELSLLGLG